VVLGGMGSMIGSVVAAAILTSLPVLMQFLAEFRMIIYALLLIIVMIFVPRGLFGTYDFSLSRLLEKLIRFFKGENAKKGGGGSGK